MKNTDGWNINDTCSGVLQSSIFKLLEHSAAPTQEAVKAKLISVDQAQLIPLLIDTPSKRTFGNSDMKFNTSEVAKTTWKESAF